MTQYNHTPSLIADYYPFGMEIQRGFGHTQPPAGNLLNNRYLYNSKEFQDDFDLNWYDYGARFYDPQIARWHSVDPLADDLMQIDKSPYAYAWNNPILLIDPDGQCPWCIGGVIGALVDITVQMTANMTLNEQGFRDAARNIDWTSVGASTVAGALGAPGANLLSKTAQVATIASVVAVDAAFDVSIAGNANVFDGSKSLTEATIDVAGSYIIGKASDRVVSGARNAIGNDISSGTYSTLNKSEITTLRQASSIVNSQGFDAATQIVVGLGGELGKSAVDQVLGNRDVPVFLPVPPDNTLPSDNTRVHLRHPLNQ